MKKVFVFACTFLFVFYLASCSDDKIEERMSYYTIIDRGDPEEIKSSSMAALEKSDVLFNLTSAYTNAWKDYRLGCLSFDEMAEIRMPLIDFLIDEGFEDDLFSGSDEEIDANIDEAGSSLFEEYIAINVAASEIMKQESLDKLIKPTE